MKILLYSLNYSPELTGIGKYNSELAFMLTNSNIDVHVLTAPPYYPEWKRHDGFKNIYSTTLISGVTIYRCPIYVPNQLNIIKRLLHLTSFAFTTALRLISLIKLKPVVVFLVQPTLFCAPATLLYCKLTGAKSIMHIQDFEVDAMFGLSKITPGKLQKFVSRIEFWFLKRFDVVSSISYTMLNNARTKGVAEEKLLFFPNWADTDFVTPEVSGASLRKQWGYNEIDKIILYSGNIGQKQGLEVVLEAAKHFKDQNEIKFLIIGNGSYSNSLQAMATDFGLDNIVFMPLQPWDLVPQILAMADVHLVVQKRGAADAVLPSKLTNILSAGGHALVTADPDTELGKIASKYTDIYHCVEPDNPHAFIEGLAYCLNLETIKTNTVARQYAVDNLNKQRVIERFIIDLKALVAKKGDEL